MEGGRGREGRREGEQFQRSLSELHWPLYFLAYSEGDGNYDEEQVESKLLIRGSLELKRQRRRGRCSLFASRCYAQELEDP